MIINFKWIFKKPNRALAFGLGSGLFIAPGTTATLFSWLIWYLLSDFLSSSFIITIIIVGFFYGCYICDQLNNELKLSDHPSIVIDEIISFWLVLLLVKDIFYIKLISFLLFRIIDIIKPFPINIVDKFIKNGFGIMLDDLFAAIFTIFIINIIF
ncbi:Phosphatidylglycerophosphatase A [Candidatus Kinetoplastibacterium sorsogonicusi]|uniref:Phosphatidylglycerophosphatase A n=1 Tax=Candidatus Kinetoplastidibacterium kentomonadis TaxID=1576550 RepID=A0A3Q8F3G1_9PROT|nr:phosphatidylglycerophosphatase A [Candidatus Kinetoplastibacterium sorsogonicusi]AWD32385.1 Phosphatidylglycerophosphatase A [Candidatus Kinetoplastibacterium sorsogonicusi]